MNNETPATEKNVFSESAIQKKIADDLASLEIKPGDTILVHSSLKSLGAVPGGAEAIVDAFIQFLGPLGTLLMPGLSFRQEPHHIHNSKETPCCVGALPEYFRKRPGTVRSLHPTHSMCGVGVAAAELFVSHFIDTTPCGSNSPFIKITERPAKIVMLGCGLKPNTTMHALEEIIKPPYLFGDECEYHITGAYGKAYQKKYICHGFNKHGWEQRYDRIVELPDTSFLRCGRVLDAETFVIDTQGLRSAVLEKWKSDILFFVSRKSDVARL